MKFNIDIDLKNLTNDELVQLRDDVSREILARNFKKTDDNMISVNLENVAKTLSFEWFSLNQCFSIAENLIKAIEEKIKCLQK